MTPLPAVDPDLEQRGPASDLITEWLAEGGGGGSVARVSPPGWLGGGDRKYCYYLRSPDLGPTWFWCGPPAHPASVPPSVWGASLVQPEERSG